MHSDDAASELNESELADEDANNEDLQEMEELQTQSQRVSSRPPQAVRTCTKICEYLSLKCVISWTCCERGTLLADRWRMVARRRD